MKAAHTPGVLAPGPVSDVQMQPHCDLHLHDIERDAACVTPKELGGDAARGYSIVVFGTLNRVEIGRCCNYCDALSGEWVS